MTRHIKLKHGAAAGPVRTREVYLDLNNSEIPSIPQTLQFPLFQRDGVEVGSKDGLTKMQNWMKNFIELANTVNSIQTQNGLRQSAGLHAQQVKNMYANNWILPKTEIQGISAFFCRRCLTFTLRPIRELGYDETEKGKHIDLHGDIDINKIQIDSMDRSDAALDDSACDILTNAVNHFMPGIKYLRASDLTSLFVYLMSKHNPEFTLRLIGIPDRWYLYPLEQQSIPKCVDRALRDLGKRVSLEDVELVDFLRKFQATYVIIQVSRETSLRWFGVRITIK